MFELEVTAANRIILELLIIALAALAAQIIEHPAPKRSPGTLPTKPSAVLGN